ncbi:alpha/beta fold hydrolase [Jiangella anatolica]|uniref:Alpha/beta hydrolase n=1 Tax=Jiangella anatolica TaxID=2670374 RepID=A0A2W2BPE3_9ACTN|nr:alpha/beta hydrolase [Jiangella anatolica]PZF82214.1 alpha/beta hydrolase [Jiangella anatolica]
MPFAQLGPGRVFYTDHGTGTPPLLLIHGWTCDSHDWRAQVGAFAAEHRVIVPDLRGHGRSSVPATGYVPRAFAADLVALLDHLGVQEFVPIGHSLGAVVAAVLAVEQAGRVLACVSVDPAYGLDDAEAATVLRQVEELRSPRGPHVAGVILEASEAAPSPALRAWRRDRIAGLRPHVVAETFAGLFEPADQVAMRPASAAYLRRRTCPVLAVHASSVRADWERELAAHPRSRVVTWCDTGHWPHQERPDEFNALVLEWLAGLRLR